MRYLSAWRNLFGVAVLSLGMGLGAVTLAKETTTKPATQPATQPYPLKVCVVSGEELGGMGDTVVYKYEGREVRFCCKMCVDDFKKDPQKYLKKLDAAQKSQKNDKAATTQPAQAHADH